MEDTADIPRIAAMLGVRVRTVRDSYAQALAALDLTPEPQQQHVDAAALFRAPLVDLVQPGRHRQVHARAPAPPATLPQRPQHGDGRQHRHQAEHGVSRCGPAA